MQDGMAMGHIFPSVLFVKTFEVILIAVRKMVGVLLQSSQINSSVRSYKDDLMSTHESAGCDNWRG